MAIHGSHGWISASAMITSGASDTPIMRNGIYIPHKRFQHRLSATDSDAKEGYGIGNNLAYVIITWPFRYCIKLSNAIFIYSNLLIYDFAHLASLYAGWTKHIIAFILRLNERKPICNIWNSQLFSIPVCN